MKRCASFYYKSSLINKTPTLLSRESIINIAEIFNGIRNEVHNIFLAESNEDAHVDETFASNIHTLKLM